MDLLDSAIAYAAGHAHELWAAGLRHVALSAAALAVATSLALPVGVWIARRRAVAEPVIAAFNALRVVPSLALLFLVVPIVGFNATSATLALAVLAAPPVLLNTVAAFRGIDPAVLEAARGMGMDARQMLRRVEAPLAAPVVLAGIRTATVEVVASATLAAWIGVGGLGAFVQRGFAVGRPEIVLVGAVPIALLALGAEAGLGMVERGRAAGPHGVT